MTLLPSGRPARRLPVRVRPFPCETTRSYVQRLARANHIPFAELLDALAADQTPQRSARALGNELYLNTTAIARLSAFSGMAAATLQRALPATGQGTAGPQPQRWWHRTAPARRPVRACARCAATSGGEILVYQPLHQPLCLPHNRWLAGQDSNRQVDLTLLPEVTRAARQHTRLTHHRPPDLLNQAYRQANQIAQAWFDRPSFLTPVWHERYDRLGASHAYGARVITYPETIGLTSILSSPHWTRQLERGDYAIVIPAFLREAGRRIGHLYPGSPGSDPLRYWAVQKWSEARTGAPARQPGHIDW